MNLEELRRIREQERSTDSLQNLRPQFYSEVADFLGELRSQRDAVASDVDDPFTDNEVKQLSDELQAAERTVEALYERRVGKIVKLASFAAADMSVDVDGLTTEEQQLFETIVDTIQTFSRDINRTLESPDSTDASDYRDAASEMDAEPDSDETADMEARPEASTSRDPTTEQQTDRTTVRITQDVGPIVGVDDRDYHLQRDDIVTLPTENAVPLIEGDAAESIEE